jgi:hypothetical protein
VTLLAVDPGTTESGYVVLDNDDRIVMRGIVSNPQMLGFVETASWADELAIEMIASYGMPVGAEVFDTCVFIGRMMQATTWCGPVLVYRRDVKMHLCGTARAKDANIRQALIDIFGPPGTVKNKGGTYGIKSHMWAALGVAATVRKLERKGTTT